MSIKVEEIDLNKLNPCACHGTNSVYYGVFHGTEQDLSEAAKDPKESYTNFKNNPKSSVCYSDLKYDIEEYFKKNTVLPNLMWNRISIQKDNDELRHPTLTLDECHQWIALCKKYGLLPEYIKEDSVKEADDAYKKSRYGDASTIAEGTIVLNIENISWSLLYIYLSSYRNMREDTGFVKGVLYLVNDLGLNFYLAYVFTTKVCMNTYGHHILPFGRDYGYNLIDHNEKVIKDVAYIYLKNLKVPINIAIGLQRFINYDDYYRKPILNEKTLGNLFFHCSSTLNTISKISYDFNFYEMFERAIVDAVMSKTDEEANKYLPKGKIKSASK